MNTESNKPLPAQTAELMRIRVPEAWTIEQHSLFDEDPVFEDGICTNLTEDLLQFRRESYTVDAGFYRDQYIVLLVRDSNWENPLRKQACQHRREVVSTVEEWLRDESLFF